MLCYSDNVDREESPGNAPDTFTVDEVDPSGRVVVQFEPPARVSTVTFTITDVAGADRVRVTITPNTITGEEPASVTDVSMLLNSLVQNLVNLKCYICIAYTSILTCRCFSYFASHTVTFLINLCISYHICNIL